MPRKPAGKRLRLFTMRVNDEEQSTIDRLARHYGRSSSEVLRDLVWREASSVDVVLDGHGRLTLD